MKESLKITIVGPCSPADVRDLLGYESQLATENLIGYRGVPVSLLAGELVAQGHQVTIVTTAPEITKDPLYLSGENFTLVAVKQRKRAKHRAMDFFLQERRALTAEIIKTKPDIVHAHWTYEFGLAALASNTPTLVTAHDAPITVIRYMPNIYRLVRFLMSVRLRQKVKFMTAVSPYLVDRWRKEMLWRKAMPVIPNITPFPTLDNSVSRYREPKTVLSIGESGVRKNIETLIRAWPKVRSAHPDAELVLVGNGLDSKSDLATRYIDNPEYEGISWLGYTEREPLKQLLNNACVLVHPSLEEAQPMVPLEGMSQGLPVVGGESSGGVPYTVGDAGLLVDVKDPSAIADAVNKLLSDAVLRDELGGRAIDRVTTHFSATAVSNLYIDEYRKVIANSK